MSEPVFHSPLEALAEEFKAYDRSERAEMLIEYADRFIEVPPAIATRPFPAWNRAAPDAQTPSSNPGPRQAEPTSAPEASYFHEPFKPTGFDERITGCGMGKFSALGVPPTRALPAQLRGAELPKSGLSLARDTPPPLGSVGQSPSTSYSTQSIRR